MQRVTWCQWSSRPAYGQPHRQHTHTDLHIQCLEFSFKESILHIIYKLNKKSNEGPLLPLRKGGNNLKFHNQRQEHSTRAIGFSNATAPCIPATAGPESLSHDGLHGGCVAVRTHHGRRLFPPKRWEWCQLPCLVSRCTAPLNVRGLGLCIVQTLKKNTFQPPCFFRQTLKNSS